MFDMVGGVSTPGTPKPHARRLAEHVTELIRAGPPIAGRHEVVEVEARELHHRWSVHITTADGGDWVIGPTTRYR